MSRSAFCRMSSFPATSRTIFRASTSLISCAILCAVLTAGTVASAAPALADAATPGPAVSGPAVSAVTQATARLGDARIHYASQGQGADAVVFIHGWACDASFWDAQMAALGANRRVIAVDLLGFGESDAPQAEYTQELLAQSLAAVLDAAQVRRAVLVGHSMGLSVAKSYIDAHPGRVAGLFIVDGVYMDLPKYEARAQGMRAVLAKPENDTDAGWRQFVAGFVQPMFSPATPQELRAKTLSAMQNSPRHAARSSMLHYLAPGSWSPAPAELPVQAVYSVGMAKNMAVAESLPQVFPRAHIEQWDDCGHFIMFDQPQRLSRAVADFAARTLP
ncbi:alpha/beta fold hydrolase [Humidesulfovibrio sp.]